MSVERLGPSAAIIAALRAEMARRNERTGNRPGPRTDDAEPAGSPPRDVATLRHSLREIVAGVSTDDAAALAAARPRIVRAILLWEFGPALREHPEWDAMLDSIVETLNRDPQHAAQLARMVAELKS
jgi:hypothetical protein